LIDRWCEFCFALLLLHVSIISGVERSNYFLCKAIVTIKCHFISKWILHWKFHLRKFSLLVKVCCNKCFSFILGIWIFLNREFLERGFPEQIFPEQENPQKYRQQLGSCQLGYFLRICFKTTAIQVIKILLTHTHSYKACHHSKSKEHC
jgi:hypothetical protein